MNWLKRRLTFANLIAAMALFAALGGVAYAAGGIGGKEIKNHSITGQDIKKGSVPLTALKRLPEGTPGPKGPAGPAGAPGSALAYGHVSIDGVLDRSKGITSARKTGGAGYYCVHPAVPFNNVIVTADTSAGVPRYATVNPSDNFTSCSPGDIVIQTYAGASVSASAFYILLN